MPTPIKDRFLAALQGWYGVYDSEIELHKENLRRSLQKLARREKTIREYKALLEAESAEVAHLEASNEKLRNGLVPIDIITLSEEHRTKYPIRRITYDGFLIQTKDQDLRIEIPLQDFISVLASHRDWCTLYGFDLASYLAKYPNSDFGEVVNLLQFDIFKKYVGRKQYMFDLDLYGVEENWASIIETWHLRKMDCENSANELMALFEAAGLVGPLKAFSWNVCGMTHSNVGHSTVYCFDFRDGIYRHLESTLTRVRKTDFHQLPTSKSTQDRMNLKSVWMSFNSDVARHYFKTDSDKDYWDSRDRFQNITIEGEE